MKTKMTRLARNVKDALNVLVIGREAGTLADHIENQLMSEHMGDYYRGHPDFVEFTKSEGECHLEYLAFGAMMKQRVLMATCELIGHDIVDDSYGNPDSGCVDLHCKRCGWSHYVCLY